MTKMLISRMSRGAQLSFWNKLALIAGGGIIAGLLLSIALAAPKKTKYDTPTLTCGTPSKISIDIQVLAGATGAPSGFSIHWVKAADLAAGADGILGTTDDGIWPPTDGTTACGASFSGNANGTSYNIAPNQTVTVQIGDNLFDNPGASSVCANEPLECGTAYVFRAFVHGDSVLNRSDFTANLTCSTSDCGEGECFTLSQGFWKTAAGYDDSLVFYTTNPQNGHSWPTSVVDDGGMSIGGTFYNLEDIYDILWTPSKGNKLLPLVHQVIAVQFSIAVYGPANDDILVDLDGANALIESVTTNDEIPPVGSAFLGDDDGYTDILSDYIKTYHCSGSEPNPEF
jgi:hypothetical protein